MDSDGLALSSSSTSLVARVKECPQLEIIQTALSTNLDHGFHTEFRVSNWRTLPSGRIIRGDGHSLVSLLLTLVLLTWIGLDFKVNFQSSGFNEFWWWWWEDRRRLGALTLLLLILVLKTRTVLYESIVPLPGIGLQLSTTRGISLPYPWSTSSSNSRLHFPLSTTRHLIPLSSISTVIINERPVRWSIRYYLAVILKDGRGVIVLFENMRQDVKVLKEIYYGIREILFDEFDDQEDGDEDEDVKSAQAGIPNGDVLRERVEMTPRKSKRRKK